MDDNEINRYLEEIRRIEDEERQNPHMQSKYTDEYTHNSNSFLVAAFVVALLILFIRFMCYLGKIAQENEEPNPTPIHYSGKIIIHDFCNNFFNCFINEISFDKFIKKC